MGMKTLRKFIKLVAFTLLLIIAFHVSTNVLIDKASIKKDEQYQIRIKEFYDEVPGTLDAVYLGASHVYTYWQAPIAWGESELAIFPFATGSQPIAAFPYLIEEIKKTQPQVMIIANLNQLVVTSAGTAAIHWLADGMPLSWNKIDMVQSLYEAGDCGDVPSVLEYLFPLIRFHSRWDRLGAQDLQYNRTDGVKGACYFDDFFNAKIDVSENYEKVDLDAKTPLSQYASTYIKNILDYCDAENVNILFVIVPQFTGVQSRTGQYNSAREYIESRGYPVLDLTQKTQDIGIDITSDYCTLNGKHLNIHGALKFTRYLAQYLLDHYDFPEKSSGGGTRVGILLTKSIKSLSRPT